MVGTDKHDTQPKDKRERRRERARRETKKRGVRNSEGKVERQRKRKW